MNTTSDYSILKTTDYITTAWSGGTTTEICIAPEGSAYADRAFDFRISSATVELEKSDFTPLSDYRRIIMSLNGPIRLQHDGGPVNDLPAFMPHSFDGASDTTSEGKVTDFNLMLRKGKCDGFILPFRMQEEELVPLQAALYDLSEQPVFDELFLYAYKGDIVITAKDGEEQTLLQGETLRVQSDSPALQCRAINGVAAVLCGVSYL